LQNPRSMAEESRTKWSEALPHDSPATLGDLAGRHLAILRIFEAAMLKTVRKERCYPHNLALARVSSHDSCMTCNLISDVTQHHVKIASHLAQPSEVNAEAGIE
jgi:hypothetical protein